MSAPSDDDHHHHHHHHDHHDHHHPHHHHHHGDGTSATQENQQYFNKLAADYDSRHEKTLDKLMEEIRARVDFIGVDWASEEDDVDDDGGDGVEKKAKKSVRLLDYACGTGVVSRALAPYTTQCVGIDLSENMVAAYNARAENQGLSPSEMRAYQGNLCVPGGPDPEALSSPEFYGFDIAAVGLGFHHFDDPALAARRLAERLRPGGVLMLLDFLPHVKEDNPHPARSTVTHHGFSLERIKQIYEEAGVGKDFGIEEVAVVFHFSKDNSEGVRRKLFISRGTKA